MKLWLDTCIPCCYPSQEVYDIESLNFASFQLKLKSRLITVPRKGSLLTTVFDKRLYFSFCKVLLTGDNSSAFYPHDRTCGLMNIWFIRLLDKLFHCILPISSFNWCRKYFCILIQFFFVFWFSSQSFSVAFVSCPRTAYCRPCWPWTHKSLSTSASRMLWLKACVTTICLLVQILQWLSDSLVTVFGLLCVSGSHLVLF